MESMFFNCRSFNQPLNDWDVSNVENMACMFNHCTSFSQPLDRWNVSNVRGKNQVYDYDSVMQSKQIPGVKPILIGALALNAQGEYEIVKAKK
jgi:surface protein